MPAGQQPRQPNNPRNLPADMAERLIVALDFPTIRQARELTEKLDGTVSFFKIGLWLAFAEGVDDLLRHLIGSGKKLFLDTKMFDIGQTVEEGVARAADRGVSFVTVHGERQIVASAVRGKRGSDIKVFAVTVLTNLSDADLRDMGYRLTAKELIALRVGQAVELGCDGIIASAHDDPDEIRRIARAGQLLIATPGIRPAGEAADDHQRKATPGEAIMRGADYLVVGRPVIGRPDPVASARRIIEAMQAADAKLRGAPR
jgi:orotidine-5'-phosphate decarboxylase